MKKSRISFYFVGALAVMAASLLAMPVFAQDSSGAKSSTLVITNYNRATYGDITDIDLLGKGNARVGGCKDPKLFVYSGDDKACTVTVPLVTYTSDNKATTTAFTDSGKFMLLLVPTNSGKYYIKQGVKLTDGSGTAKWKTGLGGWFGRNN
jgi:hypothetical protein